MKIILISLGMLAIVLLGGIGFMVWFINQPLPSPSVVVAMASTTTMPTPAIDIAGTVVSAYQQGLATGAALAPIVSTGTASPIFSPTPTATTVIITLTPSLTPTLVSDWCLWRWSASCPATWEEVKAAWSQIQATYGINFDLPVVEPTIKSVYNYWWLTLRPPVIPQLRLANVVPARPAWILGTFNVPKLGVAEFVIFTDCGNLGWRFVSSTQQPVLTPRPSKPKPQPTSPSAPKCPPEGCNPPVDPPVDPPQCPPGGCNPPVDPPVDQPQCPPSGCDPPVDPSP